MYDYRDAGGTVHQSAGITAAAVARIEATAHLPRPRGRGLEAPATAKARAALELAIIRTMRDCLARVSEAAAFTWQQIERRPDGSATITFRRPKTDADTTAYLAPATVAALDEIRHGAPDTAPLFGLSASRIKRRIAAAAQAAGLEGVSSHGCRIGMAQDLARAKGIEMPAIMQAGGWKSETTVARYTARETAARSAVARFYEQEGDAATGCKHAAWAEEEVGLWHFRNNRKREVDIVLERGDSRIIGVEVKASASVGREDFKGLAALAELAGGAFERGVLFYGG